MTDMADFRALHGRPRGFVPWKPRAETELVIIAVREVLEEYRDHLPLSLRQVFYRLVATRGFPKTERDYSRLGEYLNRARRARLIDFDAIRDDGFQRTESIGWDSPETCLTACRDTAERFRIDRQIGQPVRLVVWCEAGGMVPQLERVCAPFSVPVFSSGGFDSVTVKHNVAREFASMGAVHVLHLGDHDPSGTSVFCSLDEDVRAFLKDMDGDATFTRLAVLPEHIETHRLPTVPPKATDNRAFHGMTVQCEALPPDVLAGILDGAIHERLDWDAYDEALTMEKRGREWLLERIGGTA
jgi:hypothetical protein